MKTAEGCFSRWPEVIFSAASPQEPRQGSCGHQHPAGYLEIRQPRATRRRKGCRSTSWQLSSVLWSDSFPFSCPSKLTVRQGDCCCSYQHGNQSRGRDGLWVWSEVRL